MSILDIFKKSPASDTSYNEPEALDGAEEIRESLSTFEISYKICSFRELLTAENLQLIAHELYVPEERVEQDLNLFLEGIDKDTVCLLEYPYIEEYYRDTYYSFYARKHNDYNRHCFRISFFSQDVTEKNFFNIDIYNLSNMFLGYVVLRPTPRRIIGYSFLSPSLTSNSEMAICICKRLISVIGRNLEVVGFPFLSHDGEALSCSESSIILLFDYFSRRYNNYSRVLPSQISPFVSNNSRRYQPSVGLTAEAADQVFNDLGMTTRQYTKVDKAETTDNSTTYEYSLQPEEFESILHIFVESGIPIYASTEEHAFLIIGRENKIFEQKVSLVAMDGNRKPYSIVDNLKDIKSFIVPMPDTILLDAHLINPIKFYEDFNLRYHEIMTLKEDLNNYIHRIFLTTSRSFKKHIVNTDLNEKDKELIVCTTMPKFVWICESIHKDEVGKNPVDVRTEAVTIYDATDYPTECNHLLMAKTNQHLIVPRTDNSKLRNKTYRISECPDLLPIFQYNLKGAHTNWQG